MKRLIAITSDTFISQEAILIVTALNAGIEYIHLRKPSATRAQLDMLLSEIPPKFHSRIILNDHHELAQQYNVGGLHINNRCPAIPDWWNGRVSRSCHSIAEIKEHKDRYDYLFLSPIYDSISKRGYRAAFSHNQLLAARDTLDDKIIALGGITPHNLHRTLQYGFGGVAIMGYLWQTSEITQLTKRVELLKNEIICYNSSHTTPTDTTI